MKVFAWGAGFVGCIKGELYAMPAACIRISLRPLKASPHLVPKTNVLASLRCMHLYLIMGPFTCTLKRTQESTRPVRATPMGTGQHKPMRTPLAGCTARLGVHPLNTPYSCSGFSPVLALLFLGMRATERSAAASIQQRPLSDCLMPNSSGVEWPEGWLAFLCFLFAMPGVGSLLVCG